MFDNVLLFKNHAIYEMMWKNTAEPERPQWQYGTWAFHAGYLRLQTHTQICNAYCFSTATMVTRMCLNVTSYVCCLSCSVFFSLFPHPFTLSPSSSLACCMLSHHVMLCDLRYNKVKLFKTFSIKNLFHFQETAMKQFVSNKSIATEWTIRDVITALTQHKKAKTAAHNSGISWTTICHNLMKFHRQGTHADFEYTARYGV